MRAKKIVILTAKAAQASQMLLFAPVILVEMRVIGNSVKRVLVELMQHTRIAVDTQQDYLWCWTQ